LRPASVSSRRIIGRYLPFVNAAGHRLGPKVRATAVCIRGNP
jgi:hypothetical protein